MRVTINGFVNRDGVFRHITGRTKNARPGEVLVTAEIDVPESAFAPRHLGFTVAATEIAHEMTSAERLAARQKPRAPKPIRPVEQTGHWTGEQLMHFMARNDLDYADVARELGASDDLVRKWGNTDGTIRISAEHAAILFDLNRQGVAP